MILSFSREFPWDAPSHFKDRILTGQKKHTFRSDSSELWAPGKKIHYWMGTPRYQGNNPFQIFPDFEHVDYWLQVATDKVFTKAQIFEMYGDQKLKRAKADNWFMPLCAGIEYAQFRFTNIMGRFRMTLSIGNQPMGEIIFEESNDKAYPLNNIYSDGPIIDIAKNDGFDISFLDFAHWFLLVSEKYKVTEFDQRLIHWTNSFYVPDQAEKLNV